MDNLLNLMAMIGDQKALIIASGTSGLAKFHELNDMIFIHNMSGSVLQQHDPVEKGLIRYYIENKECRQVIFIGSIEQNIIDRIHNGNVQRSLGAGLKFNASVWLKKKTNTILSMSLHDQMLTELVVISQCRLLMDYYFIRDRVESRQLQVRGIISVTPAEQFKSVFYNGVVYNDLISMN
ncbi:MAG: hypothetical protein OEV74_02090 [Cyclobacteriaceae bacterium]|jgi:hypothetical protein|nr:hypothetical protein [Cyclobacteriaceae bacterium]MDH4295042.1 hypothetical protein [Cyclobacteriaceae bacterium]MDH5248508.1 hypothetical protein [Cyclobacteriaceae bacterium]